MLRFFLMFWLVLVSVVPRDLLAQPIVTITFHSEVIRPRVRFALTSFAANLIHHPQVHLNDDVRKNPVITKEWEILFGSRDKGASVFWDPHFFNHETKTSKTNIFNDSAFYDEKAPVGSHRLVIWADDWSWRGVSYHALFLPSDLSRPMMRDFLFRKKLELPSECFSQYSWTAPIVMRLRGQKDLFLIETQRATAETWKIYQLHVRGHRHAAF